MGTARHALTIAALLAVAGCQPDTAPATTTPHPAAPPTSTPPAPAPAVQDVLAALPGDKDPAQWRPSNCDTWCGYATAYIATKHTYGLAVDRAEHDALAAIVAGCPAGGAR